MNLSTALYISDRACPSISYRIRREIFHEDVMSQPMRALQTQILNNPSVLHIFSLQKQDGWLGGTFHGVDEPESCIRYLIEKGIEPEHLLIQDALSAIIAKGDKFDEGCMYKVGKPLDMLHLGGSILIKACVFGYAGYESYDFVKEKIEEAINVFRYVCNVENVEDIYEEYKGKLVFKSGVLWPCIYHLRLLANTRSWRNGQNKEILVKAITRLAALSPLPEIKLLYNHQVISPASVFMSNFNDDMDELTPKEWMMWFHRTELIAKLGIADKIIPIKKQIDYVNNLLKANDGFFTKKLKHYYFTKWTQYMGLALEDNWRHLDRMINDLTFRCLLINSLMSQA